MQNPRIAKVKLKKDNIFTNTEKHKNGRVKWVYKTEFKPME